jgi:hypothetical protein
MTKRFNISLEDLQEINLPENLNDNDTTEVVDANSETVVDAEQNIFNDVIDQNQKQSEIDDGFDNCERFMEVAATLESISSVLKKMPNIDGGTYMLLGASADMATAGTPYSSSSFMPSLESIKKSVKEKNTSFAAESLADKAHSIYKDVIAFIQKLIQNAKDMVGKLIASFGDYSKALVKYKQLINDAEKSGNVPKKEFELTSVPASVLGENGFINFNEYTKDLKTTIDYFTKLTGVSEDMSVLCFRRLSDVAKSIQQDRQSSQNREILKKVFADIGIQDRAVALGMKKENGQGQVSYVGPTLLGAKRGVFTFEAKKYTFAGDAQDADNTWVKMKYDFTTSETATDQRNNKAKATPIEVAKKIHELASELLEIEKKKLSEHAAEMKKISQFNLFILNAGIEEQAKKLFNGAIKLFANISEFVIQLNSKPTSYLRYVLSGSIWSMKTILNAQEGQAPSKALQLTN